MSGTGRVRGMLCFPTFSAPKTSHRHLYTTDPAYTTGPAESPRFPPNDTETLLGSRQPQAKRIDGMGKPGMGSVGQARTLKSGRHTTGALSPSVGWEALGAPPAGGSGAYLPGPAFSRQKGTRSEISRTKRAARLQHANLLVASAALAHPVSREWTGYWQRRV